MDVGPIVDDDNDASEYSEYLRVASISENLPVVWLLLSSLITSESLKISMLSQSEEAVLQK